MRKSISNLDNVQSINTENITGGKRYGLVNARTPEGYALVKAYTKSGKIMTKEKISDRITLYTNANGDDICIEW